MKHLFGYPVDFRFLSDQRFFHLTGQFKSFTEINQLSYSGAAHDRQKIDFPCLQLLAKIHQLEPGYSAACLGENMDKPPVNFDIRPQIWPEKLKKVQFSHSAQGRDRIIF